MNNLWYYKDIKEIFTLVKISLSRHSCFIISCMWVLISPTGIWFAMCIYYLFYLLYFFKAFLYLCIVFNVKLLVKCPKILKTLNFICSIAFKKNFIYNNLFQARLTYSLCYKKYFPLMWKPGSLLSWTQVERRVWQRAFPGSDQTTRWLW